MTVSSQLARLLKPGKLAGVTSSPDAGAALIERQPCAVRSEHPKLT
jgi:hypothetical protein